MPRKRIVAVLAWAALVSIAGAGIASTLRIRRAAADAARDRAMNETVRTAGPLIAAISRYEQKTGKPPERLANLTPDFLPAIPWPAAAHNGEWYYEKRGDPSDGRGGWVLGIMVRDDLSPQYWGFGDYFVYQPNRRYDQTGYGGGLWKRYGDWAYYLE